MKSVGASGAFSGAAAAFLLALKKGAAIKLMVLTSRRRASLLRIKGDGYVYLMRDFLSIQYSTSEWLDKSLPPIWVFGSWR
jgi:hypothetical protein